MLKFVKNVGLLGFLCYLSVTKVTNLFHVKH